MSFVTLGEGIGRAGEHDIRTVHDLVDGAINRIGGLRLRSMESDRATAHSQVSSNQAECEPHPSSQPYFWLGA
jgi:hypothetical protein